MRILAADDDDGIRTTLARLLHRWGYDVVIACDGADAWRRLREENAPRVVILDWDMPGMTGVEVCRLLRATPNGEHAYVLMLTGRQDTDDVVAALGSGADDFLSKPFDPRELQLRLAKGVRALGRVDAPSSQASSAWAPLSGATLGGKYRLERRIAEGGMGSVWLAVHLALGINVAVKFVHPHLAEIADYASFEREARAAAQLRSDHIVRVYDHGLTEQASPYLVMEYLNGESLSARLNRLGPLSPTDVLAFVTQASLALGEAHGHGIIHGDVKPENVLFEDVDRHGEFRMKLVDFGLAKRIEPGRGRDGRTVAGTPSYMSPECLGGAVQPDTFLDMWGLAASAFDAMTGQTAFIGATLRETVARVCEAPLPVPSTVNPNVSAGFDAWFARACAREPSARFQTPAEMVAALKAAHDAIVPRELRNLPRSQGALGFAPTEPDAGDPSRNGPLIPT